MFWFCGMHLQHAELALICEIMCEFESTNNFSFAPEVIDVGSIRLDCGCVII